MSADHPIFAEIRSLLDAARESCTPALAEIESILTDGYAAAMALEAERSRLERRIAGLALQLDGEAPPPETRELPGLARRLQGADEEIAILRDLLASLRIRANELRVA
jgi:hypothetical protein